MRITARGAGLLAAAVVALGAGFAFGYPELGLLGTAGLVAVGFAVAHAAWRPALHVRRAADPDRVPRGDACTVTLTVANASRTRAATLIADDRCGPHAVPVPLVRLRPRRDTEVSYPVPTHRRGVVPIGPLRVIRQDPLGLVAVAQGHGDVVRVWVYPRIHPLTAVPAGVVRSLDGRVDRVPHGSITFDTLREYVIGDELRHVHWRTSARVGELMVREHLDTSLPRIVVLLDDRASAYPDATGGTGGAAGTGGAGTTAETFEAACEAAASVVAAAVREELPVALHLVSGVAAGTGGRRAETARPFLDLLAEAELRPAERAAGKKDRTRGRPGAGRAGGSDTGRDGGGRADATGGTAGGDALTTVLDGLRYRPAGDTLVFLTGAGGRAGLGRVASLRGRYPSLLAAVFGAADPVDAGADPNALLAANGGAGTGTGKGIRGGTGGNTGGGARTGSRGPVPRGDGLVLLEPRDGADFAAEWEGTRAW